MVSQTSPAARAIPARGVDRRSSANGNTAINQATTPFRGFSSMWYTCATRATPPRKKPPPAKFSASAVPRCSGRFHLSHSPQPWKAMNRTKKPANFSAGDRCRQLAPTTRMSPRMKPKAPINASAIARRSNPRGRFFSSASASNSEAVSSPTRPRSPAADSSALSSWIKSAMRRFFYFPAPASEQERRPEISDPSGFPRGSSAPARLNLRFRRAGERPRFIPFPPPGK